MPLRKLPRAPLVSFDSTSGNVGFKPEVIQYARAVRAVRIRYSYIRTCSPWNETNIDEALAGDPFRSGKFWQELDNQCHPAGAAAECLAIGGTFLEADRLLDTLMNHPEATGVKDGTPENTSSSMRRA